MRSRDVVLLSAAGLLALAVALPFFGQATEAGLVTPPTITPPPDEQDPEHVPLHAVAVDGGPVQPQLAVVDPVFRKSERVDTTGWTDGVIRGDIALTASIVGKIQALQVVVDELRPLDNKEGKRPFRAIQRIELGVGTPTFEVVHVPFSPYGFVVSAWSPGLNGNQVTVQLTAEQPLVDDVRLAITPSAPFSLLLRDQESLPVTDTEVRMVPIGPPLGRPLLYKVSDNYGSAVFENTLAGDYEVQIGPASAPLTERQVVTVPNGGIRVINGGVQPQGQTLIVPRGTPVTVFVSDPNGYGIEGVTLRMEATDRKVLTVVEGTTDVRGRCTWSRVQAGVWVINAVKPDYDRGFKQVNLDGKQEPPEQQITLTRAR